MKSFFGCILFYFILIFKLNGQIINEKTIGDSIKTNLLLNNSIDLLNKRNYDLAQIYADSAKSMLILSDTKESLQYANVLHQIARIKSAVNQYNESIEINKEALKIRTNILGANDVEVAKSLNNLGNALNFTGKYQEALETHKQALNIRINYFGEDHIETVPSYINIGNSYSYMSNYQSALEYYEIALKIRTEVLGKDHFSIAQILNNMGFCFENLGQYQKGIPLKEEALVIILKNRDPNHPEVAETYNNLGNSHEKIGDYDKSIFYHKEALKIRKLNFGDFHTSVATSYINLGVALKNKGNYSQALEYTLLALDIKNKQKDNNIELAKIYNNLGVIYFEKDEFEYSLEYYLKALELVPNIKGTQNTETANLFTNIGNVYRLLNNLPRSMDFHKGALNIFLETNTIDHKNVVAAYQNIGDIYFQNKNYDLTLEYHNSALNVLKKIKLQDTHEEAMSYFVIGNCYHQNNLVDEAFEFHDISLKIRLNIFGLNNALVVQSLNKIGNLYLEKRDTISSIEAFNNALKANKYSEGNFEQVLDLFELSQTLLSLAKINFEGKNIDQCQSYILHSIDALTYKYSVFKSNESIVYWQNENIKTIEVAFNLMYNIYKIKPVNETNDLCFSLHEKTKSYILKNKLKETKAFKYSNIPDSLIRKEYYLKEELNTLNKKYLIHLNPNLNKTDSYFQYLNSLIFDLKREQEALIETFEKNYPSYFRLKYDISNISLEETQQKLLQKEQTMLEYFVGDSSIFIFVVKQDTFHAVQIKKDFSLDSLVKQLQNGLYGYYAKDIEERTDILYKKSINDYVKASQEIYLRVVAPIEHLLTPELIIVPDGVLGYVPFETLLKSKPEKLSQFDSYPYLLKEHTISYNYSATLWNEMKTKKHKKEPTKSLLAFAPFYEGSYEILDSTIQLVFDTLPNGRDTVIFENMVSRKNFAPLPSSGIEASTASKMWKGTYFINNDATEQAFYDNASDYRIIHLSTHGVADARQGDYSYLAFAEQKDDIENEFLFVRDLYNTQLNSDLVFLSACETAQGELQRGEGIISLARAFAYAGAKSIITTLWQVDDTATKNISIEFYKNLKKGFAKDASLRKAKLSHLKNAKSSQKHPFFWASFIGLGDMSEVK